MSAICMLLCITSCNFFETPAKAKRIGCGQIQRNGEIYFVVIDSVEYIPNRVYTNNKSRDGRYAICPVEGMLVTAFTLRESKNAEFIAGDLTEQELEEYFTVNSTPGVIFLCVLFGFTLMGLYFKHKKENGF